MSTSQPRRAALPWSRLRKLATGAVAAAALSAAALSAAAPAQAVAPPPDHLQPGQSLTEGQALYSQEYAGVELILQTDGNLVAYVASNHRVLWASNTSGSGSVLRFQTDGNVVLYNAANHAVWNTATYGSRAAIWFGPETDGNITALNAAYATVWQSGTAVVSPSSFLVGHLTASNGLYSAVMQPDGNFVVYSYRGHTHPLWASGTAGHLGALLVKQSDGNLVIYQASHALWATNTLVGPSADLEMQDDANLVIYAKVNGVFKPVWATNTAGRQ
jgi:pseudomonalisin